MGETNSISEGLTRPFQRRKFNTRYWLQLGSERVETLKQTVWYSEITITRTQGINLLVL